MKKYLPVSCKYAHITDGFWFDRQQIMKNRTAMAIYDRFSDTGRFASLDFAWKPGDENCPHIFWDSDIAKWIEGCAYILQNQRDEGLEKLIDECVDKIEAHQWPDGYFNIHFTVAAPEKRFTTYTEHELYDLGHLIEAAIAYRDATGKDKLMRLMDKYVDLVDRVFRIEHSAGFDTPGHEEIELALYKFYCATGNEKYLTLMRYFINTRGTSERDNTYDVFGIRSYSQAHLPVREQTTAEGHCVRAVYLYSAMADLAAHDGDEALAKACDTLFDNIVNKRMYITGGIGSSHLGEAFTFDYDLMNRVAYAETCASLGLALFARRMALISPKGKYHDIAELCLYNGMLAGISLDGESFFYENPLEVYPNLYHQNQVYKKSRDHVPEIRRKRVFDCSCCPPNVLRLIASVQDFAMHESKDTLYIDQYMSMEADTNFGPVRMETAYPYEGDVAVTITTEGSFTLAMRLPGWADEYELTVNGENVHTTTRDGYVYITRRWQAGDEVNLSIEMNVKKIHAHPALHDNAGCVAIRRGPIVYCLEETDNGANLRDLTIQRDAEFDVTFNSELNVPALTVPGTRTGDCENMPLYSDAPYTREETLLTFIPYFAWANRTEGEMLVWVRCE